MRAFFSKHGINWTWYAEVLVSADGQATILTHDRKRWDDSHPKTVGTFEMVEVGHARHVTAIDLTMPGGKAERLTITNPGYVFGFPRFA
jgi:hypothetical protein